MRYNVGEEKIFLKVNFQAARLRFGSLYLPWEDKLENIELKKLRCEEHHRVPGNWDDEVKHDGFIFVEYDGTTTTRYRNQWPRASYGQLDTSMDYKVIDNNSGELTFYTDAEEYLSNILRGIRDLKKEEKQKEVDALQAHFDEVVKLIEELGHKAEVKPVEFKKLDGTVETHDDILETVISKV